MKAEMYKILLKVDNGELTPEQAQIELLNLSNSILHNFKGIRTETYKGRLIRNCKTGLYQVFWRSGGSSTAAIGMLHDGTRWIASTNWTSENNPTAMLSDKMIDTIERIVLLYGQE